MGDNEEWKENAIEQSLKRIVDCINDNIEEEPRKSVIFEFYPTIEEQDVRGTLVSYPGILANSGTVRVSTKQIDQLDKMLNEKGLIDDFSKIARNARQNRSFGFRSSEFIHKLLAENVDESSLISTAIDEVLERPTIWYATAYFYGLTTGNFEFSLDQLVLRGPKDEDFPIFQGLGRDDSVYAGFSDDCFEEPDSVPIINRWEPVHSIAKWDVSSIPKKRDVENELRREVERILQELRLIKADRFMISKWSAFTETALTDPISITESGMRSSQSTGFDSITRFDEKDAEKFNLIADAIIRRKIAEEDLARRIARARSMYNLSCERADVESILFSVIGLETLYTDGNQELRHKLAFRTATLLNKLWGDKGYEVYERISAAYNIRSKFVHGGALEKHRDAIENIVQDLREYLRCSILIWLGGVLSEDTTSQDMRKKIDVSYFKTEADSQVDDFLSTVFY